MTGDISLDSWEEQVHNLQLQPQMEALQASKATTPKLWEEQKRSIDAKLAENKRKKVQGQSKTVEAEISSVHLTFMPQDQAKKDEQNPIVIDDYGNKVGMINSAQKLFDKMLEA
ncbi:hypothetical protein GOBAR_DD26807 [Gossypium barbadense]|nr:hypothetical protein GOBAR_DD26807 [Gossypium barbadense]